MSDGESGDKKHRSDTKNINISSKTKSKSVLHLAAVLLVICDDKNDPNSYHFAKTYPGLLCCICRFIPDAGKVDGKQNNSRKHVSEGWHFISDK